VPLKGSAAAFKETAEKPAIRNTARSASPTVFIFRLLHESKLVERIDSIPPIQNPTTRKLISKQLFFETRAKQQAFIIQCDDEDQAIADCGSGTNPMIRQVPK